MLVKRYSDSQYIVEAQYRPKLVQMLGRLDGAFYRGQDKAWIVPKRHESQLRNMTKWFNGSFTDEKRTTVNDLTIPPMPDLAPELLEQLPNLIKRQPLPFPPYGFPYQHKGIAYNLSHKRVINGDDMGLGKTAETIITLILADYLYKQDPENNPPVFPCLIICPATLKLNWVAEFEKFTHLKPALILNDSIKNNFMQYFKHGLSQIFIINYESLKKYFVHEIIIPKGKKLSLQYVKFKPVINDFNSVVLDEIHKCKSFQTQQSKFVKGITAGKKWIFGLSGTVVVNNPGDAMPQLGIIEQFDKFANSKASFEAHFCSGPRRASNLKELNFLLNKHCFFRRMKMEVLKELPSKMRQVVYCEIDTQQEYDKAANDLATYLKEFRQATDEQVQRSLKGEIMVRIGILKNISARGKINDVSDFIDNTIEEGHKLSVFCHQHEIVDRLSERYPGVYRITGRETTEQRQSAVIAFQKDPSVKLILLGIQAAGVGITLTAGSRTSFVELGWNPATHDQCEDRHHRLGQTDSVQCTYFIGKGTIDEDIYKLIDEKRVMANTVLGNEETTVVEKKTMDELISILTSR